LNVTGVDVVGAAVVAAGDRVAAAVGEGVAGVVDDVDVGAAASGVAGAHAAAASTARRISKDRVDARAGAPRIRNVGGDDRIRTGE
jgi:hypothetical protein